MPDDARIKGTAALRPESLDALFQGNKIHSAFRAFARLLGDNLKVHGAGIFLSGGGRARFGFFPVLGMGDHRGNRKSCEQKSY